MPVQYEPGFFGYLAQGISQGAEGFKGARDQAYDRRTAEEERKKAENARMAQLILQAYQTGSVNAADATRQLAERGFNLGALAPTQLEMQRNIMASPQGVPTTQPMGIAPTMGGRGAMRVAPPTVQTFTPHSDLAYEAAGLKTPAQREAETAGLRAQTRVSQTVASATPAQLTAKAGLPTPGKLGAERRSEFGDIVQRDATGMVWKSALAMPGAKPLDWAGKAFNEFRAARLKDGAMTPAEVAAEEPSFFAAAQAAKTSLDELRRRQQETDQAKLRLDREGIQSAGPLLTSVTNEMKLIQDVLGNDIQYTFDPEGAKKRHPEYAQQITRYQQLQQDLQGLQQAVAKQLKLDIGQPPPAVVKLSSPRQQTRFDALSKIPAEARSAALVKGLKDKTLTQQEYDELSKALGITTPYQTGGGGRTDTAGRGR